MKAKDTNNKCVKKVPEYKDIAKAVGYWVVLNDLCDFFENARMTKVHKHLAAACKEIDLIWSEFESKNK